MRNSLSTCGSVAVWFDKGINPGIFSKNENYLWKRFHFFDSECSIISEGNKVSAVLELGQNKERTIISALIDNHDSEDLHTLMLKWTDRAVSIYMDNEYLNKVKICDSLTI